MNPLEIKDAALREAMLKAEQALDGGDYAASVHQSVDAFTRLVTMRPDMIITNPGHGRLGMGGPRPWPSDHGVRLLLSDDRHATLTFTKERFTLSEAATYFEYTLDLVTRAQRHPLEEITP